MTENEPVPTICYKCDPPTLWPSWEAWRGHQSGHSWKARKIAHGTVRGYQQERRRIREGLLKRHCGPCRDAWNEYYEQYRAERQVARANKRLKEILRKRAGG